MDDGLAVVREANGTPAETSERLRLRPAGRTENFSQAYARSAAHEQRAVTRWRTRVHVYDSLRHGGSEESVASVNCQWDVVPLQFCQTISDRPINGLTRGQDPIVQSKPKSETTAD